MKHIPGSALNVTRILDFFNDYNSGNYRDWIAKDLENSGSLIRTDDSYYKLNKQRGLQMFAVVDFDRQKSFFFTDFQSASDFIAQYSVITNTVVVDLSEQQPAVEKL